MGSVRWSLAGVVALMLLAGVTLPAGAQSDDIAVHGIEAAAVVTLDAAEDVGAPWQPLFASVEEVVEGNNPLVQFGVLAARATVSPAELARSLPAGSPIETLQTGSIAYYEDQAAVTFALIRSPLPASNVEGEVVEFAFYWRWAGLPTQPANPDANGDAAVDATNSFSIGTIGGEPFTTFTQSDGTGLIEYDSSSIAAWEFVAGDMYNVLIAIPGLPEAVWASALNAESSADAAGFAIQIAPRVTGFAEELTFTLEEQHVLPGPDLTAAWYEMSGELRSAADLVGTDSGTDASTGQVDAGAALPANPPLEVDATGGVVDSTSQDASGSLWRWIVGIFVGAGVVALLLWLLVFRPRRPSTSWDLLDVRVKPDEAREFASQQESAGAPVVDDHVIVESLVEWERAIDGFDLHVTDRDRLRGYVRASFGEGRTLATGGFGLYRFLVRSESENPTQAHRESWEEIRLGHSATVGIDRQTGAIRLLPFDPRIEAGVDLRSTQWADDDRIREGEPMLGGQDEYLDKHGRPV